MIPECPHGYEHGQRGKCHDCRYAAGLVLCDDESCTAKLEPKTLDEWKRACEHWHHHSIYSGCSHGY